MVIYIYMDWLIIMDKTPDPNFEWSQKVLTVIDFNQSEHSRIAAGWL